MKTIIIAMILASCGCRTYYDGEGNKIPHKAVKLLITSQFVIIDSNEQKTLDKYFYATKH